VWKKQEKNRLRRTGGSAGGMCVQNAAVFYADAIGRGCAMPYAGTIMPDEGIGGVVQEWGTWKGKESVCNMRGTYVLLIQRTYFTSSFLHIFHVMKM
jgi:hypothetical protein